MNNLSIVRMNELFCYDPIIGLVTYKEKRGPRKKGAVAGSLKKSGSVEIQFGGRMIRRGRLAWALTHGEWPDHVIDHINHNRSDDRISNLRDVTQAVNQRNQSGKRINNTTGHVGVSFHKRKGVYASTIYVNGKSIFLGEFKDLDYAVKARNAGKRIHHGVVEGNF